MHKKTSLTLPPDVYEMLVKLCEINSRSQSNMVEVLIKAEAKKQNIKIK